MATSADTLLDEALALATEAASQAQAGQALPSLRDRRASHPRAEGYFAFARAMLKGQARHVSAPLRTIDLVEAATRLPLAAGLAQELQVFLDLMNTPESAALRHVFVAERAAGKIADVPASTPTRAVQHVAVVGAGTMGSGIAMACLNAEIGRASCRERV